MTGRRIAAAVLGVVCLTVLEYRVVDMIQHDTRGIEVQTAEGILTGHPPLRTYQSRLLGPAMVAGVQTIAHVSFDRAYGLVTAGLLLSANLLCFALARRGGQQAGWFMTALSAALFVAFQDRDWLHVWDFVDAVVLLAFAWAVVTRGPTWLVVALFGVELFNREAAIVIALWIAIDAVTVTRRRFAIDWRRLLVGVALTAGGAWWIRYIRGRLFVQESFPMRPGYELVQDQVWMLRHNLAALADIRVRLDIVMVLAVFGITAILLARAWRVLGERAWKVAVLLGVMVAATFLFGFITELRVWLGLEPFWLWLFYAERMSGAPGLRVTQTQAQPSR